MSLEEEVLGTSWADRVSVCIVCEKEFCSRHGGDKLRRAGGDLGI